MRTFGTPLGPLPKQRAGTNGIVLRHGYIIAQFGDTKASDPVYSVAKSFLSTVASLAVERGLIRSVNDPVANYIHDGGYASPHNSTISWKNHLQQESEWEGILFGKNADFLGAEQFGRGERKPREIQSPGSFYEYNDVRINRFSLSLARLFGTGVPDVLKSSIMDPIGASPDWKWVPYDNSQVEINGRRIGSVSGGGPASSFGALGNGSNIIWIDPEHDIVLVWHWYQNQAMDGMVQRIMEAVVR